jgi:hypothetical protein
MNRYLIILLALVVTSSLQAQIYQWTDSNGIVHFSDIPHPGAKKLNIPDAQTFSPRETQSTSEQIPQEVKESERGYTSVVITEPKNDATIRNNQGYVPVIVAVNPDLKGGDQLQIIYDGAVLGKPQASMIFALNDVKRGTHTIAVQIVDEDGSVLNTSEEVMIYMHRPMAGMVPGTKPKNTP